MKSLHRPDLFGWTQFDETRNLDFHSVLWVRKEGNVIFDPLELSSHDRRHLEALGGVQWIALTNSDHLRAAAKLAIDLKAKVAVPAAEEATFQELLPLTQLLREGDELVPGLLVMEMHGSKTPGELVFVLDGHTLITGDLVRGQAGGKLNLLPPAKLRDPLAAAESARRLANITTLEAVLVGDGWPIFRDAVARLKDL